MLKTDHAKVKSLLAKLESTTERGVKLRTKIGFLSFGRWSAAPYSEVRSAPDALIQSIELVEAVERVGGY